MNLSRSEEITNKDYRHGLVGAQIEVDLPLQIRALRKQLVGTQPDMAKLTGMKQPRISAMEKPGNVNFNLETLRRLAKAFDVALIVRFAPFSELLDWSENFNPDTFRIPSFEEEVKTERDELATSQVRCAIQANAKAGAGDTSQWTALLVANQIACDDTERLTRSMTLQDLPGASAILTQNAEAEISKANLRDSLNIFRKGPRIAFRTAGHLPPVTTAEAMAYLPAVFAGLECIK
jgi:transcriptional regulator with XRE-family HTH domain